LADQAKIDPNRFARFSAATAGSVDQAIINRNSQAKINQSRFVRFSASTSGLADQAKINRNRFARFSAATAGGWLHGAEGAHAGDAVLGLVAGVAGVVELVAGVVAVLRAGWLSNESFAPLSFSMAFCSFASSFFIFFISFWLCCFFPAFFFPPVAEVDDAAGWEDELIFMGMAFGVRRGW
jgi:hypothetical protein